ncbi:hypothetical protein BAUCODRAFT_39706 [Baudoinia panamericana UAMH 10762]|uniref:Uncharacterized protein n=1 Tax=Baudoinia panamericana (strain UAMH 10762) TaxID=717646 RepID=M2MWD4_BAUPA|nr:uncharacterized protein BAUCODRAFT_39706 [Baudoinia panamericana UAMH 10762]EMC90894.1 hypothetical protein BAUCODRAFT_39706 [Baudoinia panamericana UAMH 10762]
MEVPLLQQRPKKDAHTVELLTKLYQVLQRSVLRGRLQGERTRRGWPIRKLRKTLLEHKHCRRILVPSNSSAAS